MDPEDLLEVITLSSVGRRDRATLRRLRSGSTRATGAGLLWVSQADEDDAESG